MNREIIVKTIVGYIFLVTALVGALGFLAYLCDWNMFDNGDRIFGRGDDGGASMSPVMVGILAGIGAYFLGFLSFGSAEESIDAVTTFQTAIGYVLVGIAVIGALGFLSYLFDWDLFNHDSEVFGRGRKGGASTSPVLVALLALVGSGILGRLRKKD